MIEGLFFLFAGKECSLNVVNYNKYHLLSISYQEHDLQVYNPQSSD